MRPRPLASGVLAAAAALGAAMAPPDAFSIRSVLAALALLGMGGCLVAPHPMARRASAALLLAGLALASPTQPEYAAAVAALAVLAWGLGADERDGRAWVAAVLAGSLALLAFLLAPVLQRVPDAASPPIAAALAVGLLALGLAIHLLRAPQENPA